MSSPAAAATTTTTTTTRDPGEGLASQHKLKLKPPSYDGDYSTFEDWHYKFKAYWECNTTSIHGSYQKQK